MIDVVLRIEDIIKSYKFFFKYLTFMKRVINYRFLDFFNVFNKKNELVYNLDEFIVYFNITNSILNFIFIENISLFEINYCVHQILQRFLLIINN